MTKFICPGGAGPGRFLGMTPYFYITQLPIRLNCSD